MPFKNIHERQKEDNIIQIYLSSRSIGHRSVNCYYLIYINFFLIKMSAIIFILHFTCGRKPLNYQITYSIILWQIKAT